MPTKSTPSFTIAGGIAMLFAGVFLAFALVILLAGVALPLRWDILLPVIIGLGFLYFALMSLFR